MGISLAEDLLRKHEGYRRIAYQDSLGVWTVGIGHNLSKPLSNKAIEQMFSDDLSEAYNDCLHEFPWFADLSERRQAVVVNLCFNLGLPRLRGFTRMLSALAVGKYDTAANELLDSLYAKQVKGRALELAALLRGSDEV